MSEQLLSIAEYARAFNLSDMTVRRRIKTGRLQAFLQEGKYFIPVNASDSRSRAASQMRPTSSEFSDDRMPQTVPSQMPVQTQRNFNEMQVIKAAPSMPMHNGYHTQAAQPAALRPNNKSIEAEGGAIPQTLKRPLYAQETSLVDTRALLAFCEASMRKSNDAERRQVEKFKARLETLEATLGQRNLEIQNLHQQVEDLQLLVKVLERKRSA